MAIKTRIPKPHPLACQPARNKISTKAEIDFLPIEKAASFVDGCFLIGIKEGVMELESYELEANADGKAYFFYSQGPRGRIKKIVRFNEIQRLGRNAYNLAFGDLDETSMAVNDKIVTNNNDRLKILATVARVVDRFVESRPHAIIYIKGSTLSRIRLYQMAIAAFWLEINQRYEIMGKTGLLWIPFQRGVNFEEFLVYRKIV